MEKNKRMDVRLLTARGLSGGLQLRGFSLVAMLIACFVLPCVLLVALHPNISVLTLQSSTQARVHIQVVKEEIIDSQRQGVGKRILLKDENKADQTPTLSSENKSVEDTEDTGEMKSQLPVPDQDTKDTEDTNSQLIVPDQETDNNGNMTGVDAPVSDADNSSTREEEIQRQNAELVSVPLVYKKMRSEENLTVAGAALEKLQESSDSLAGNQAAVSNIQCDFSEERSDTCSLRGDIRVSGRSSSITVVSQSRSDLRPDPFKIRPYARKWEPQLMERIREFTVSESSNPNEAPRCSVNHTAPAIVFSTGGFVGNFFHDFTDVLVPLFITSRRYEGEVHFLVTDFNYGWISKFQPILSRLSKYDIIDIDQHDNVHCFPQVHLGLISHRELGMDSSKTPNGVSMSDFRDLLRSSFSLKRKSVGAITDRKPRLLIMLRKGSRSFTNARQVVAMGKRAGFKVVAAGPEDAARDLARFARIVNSCDVMTGVHGAGLTNMVFLPDGASVIQILPWGGLHYACWHDFGAPAPDMGLSYLEYEIKEKESSLINKYSRNDAVFKDPLSIHKKGFGAIWSVFLQDQTVKLDVRRFKGVLLEALQAVH